VNATALHQLAWHLPEPKDDKLNSRTRIAGETGVIDYDLDRFLDAYTNLGFGWHAVKTLAVNRQDFPTCLEGEDEIVFRAYLHNCSKRYFCQEVWEAEMLKKQSMHQSRSILEAMLLATDATPEAVADHLGLSLPTVLAYEKLFFNIFDRRQDELFLASVAYPHGRFVETFDTYSASEPLHMLLRRLGYNTSMANVLHWGGLRSGLLEKLASSATTPSQLEALIMANGYMLAQAGFMNQQANSTGLHHAKTLLTAAKAGGEDNAPVTPFASLGSLLRGEIKRVKGAEQDMHIKQRMGLNRARKE